MTDETNSPYESPSTRNTYGWQRRPASATLAGPLAIAAGAVILLAALFSPLVWGFVLALPPVGGEASLWQISPLATILAGLGVVSLPALAYFVPQNRVWKPLLATSLALLMACVGAIGYTFSPIAEIAFHPYATGMFAFGALFLLAGALFLKPRRAAGA